LAKAYLVWDVDLKRGMIGDVPSEMFKHFFRSFCDTACCNLNINEGENDHHKIEAVFKAFGKSVAMAIARHPVITFPVPKKSYDSYSKVQCRECSFGSECAQPPGL
jgi:imidazoleglycerol-phosphate dehydratase/histidinol-phosphatase